MPNTKHPVPAAGSVARDKYDRIIELRGIITEADRQYYGSGTSTRTDDEYDRLFAELYALEIQMPSMPRDHSPTRNVGWAQKAGPKVKHVEKMLSLRNIWELDDITKFYNSIPEGTAIATPKLDGVALELTYENFRLVKAVTRGDGEEGEDVTHIAKTIRSIPLLITSHPHTPDLCIRGEVVMYKDAFEMANQKRLAEGKNAFACARNAVAGILGRKDSRKAAEEPLRFVAHGISPHQWELFTDYAHVFDVLSTGGFELPPLKFLDDAKSAAFLARAWEDERDDFAYDIDGVVYLANSFASCIELGVASRWPHWAVAFKFAAQVKKTVLRDITVQVGRTGVLTPLAHLDPVVLGGVTVTKATLHNIDFIRQHDLRIGDEVWVQRAGDVIPQITLNATAAAVTPLDTRGRAYRFPEVCPSCGTVVVRVEDAAAVTCPNKSCPEQLVQSIKHWVGRSAANIDGIGGKIIEQLVERGYVKNLFDLYTVKVCEFEMLEKVGAVKAYKLVTAIEESRYMSSESFIIGLGIHLVGETITPDLVARFGSVVDVLNATKADLLEMDGVGEGIANSLTQYSSVPENTEVIVALMGIITFEEPPDVVPTGVVLSGKKVCITGSFEGMNRDQLKRYLLAAGAIVTKSITKDLDILVCGESPGSKRVVAEKRGVAIMSLADLQKMGVGV